MMPAEIDPFELTARLDAVLNTDQIKKLVKIYFSVERSNPFAGATFDLLGENPSKRFVMDDLLALNLLDISLDAEAIRRISDGEFDAALAQLPTSLTILDLEGTVYLRANEIWQALRALPGVGPTTASKLLSRKRPKLIPIRDGIVNDVLGLGKADWWSVLPFVLGKKGLASRIDELDPRIDGYTPSTLRLMDVAIWMLGSNSGNTKQARASVNVKRCKFPIC